MFGYIVEIDQWCMDSDYSSEQFGPWNESWANSFKKVCKKVTPGSPDIVSEQDFAQGDEVYVVWVEYSSGNSFGFSVRSGVEAIAIVKDHSIAEEVSAWITSTQRGDDWKYTENFTASNGEVFTIYVGQWTGYFENLENVNIEHTVISVP